MSGARRIRAHAREAWRAQVERLERAGVVLEPWPATDAPKQRSYGTAIPTEGLDLDCTKVVVARSLDLLAHRLEGERARVAADAIVFVKTPPVVEVLANEVRLSAVVGFARRASA